MNEYSVIMSGRLTTLESGHFPGLMTGLDASKPTSPTKDMTYYARDTGKTYVCFVNGIWSLTGSPCLEEYSNHLGTIDNIQKTTVTGTGTATETVGAGIHEMLLSTGIMVGTAQYYSDITVPIDALYFELNMKINSIANGVSVSEITVLGLEGYHCSAFFYQDAAQLWSCVTDDGSSTSTTNISAPVDGDLLTIKGLNGRIYYYVNGVIVASHDGTAHTGVSGLFSMRVSNGQAFSSARKIAVDYIGWRVYK